MTIPKPKREKFLVQRAVKKQLGKLGLDRAERVLVKACSQCPCCSWRQDEPECSLGTALRGRVGCEVPPHNCPLRARALSVAIDPAV